MLTRRPFATCLLTLLLCAPAWAHNGRLAVAPAVEGIVVDGDLSDWPRHLPRYPISNPAAGQRPTDDADLTASFRAGYDAQRNRLLIAVEVADESVLDGRPVGAWDEADGCELYLDVTHGTGRAVQLSRWGQTESVVGPLVPGTVRYGVVTAHTPGGRVYEWWVDVGSLGSGSPLQPGIDIAFDLAVVDRDADGSFTWMSWGPQTSKLQERGRLGDLLLVAGPRSLTETLDYVGDLIGRSRQMAVDEARRSVGLFSFLAGALLAVTFLHLLLYLFERASRVNLYHGLFAGSTSVALGLAYYLPGSGIDGDTAMRIAWVGFVALFVTGLLLLYAQFHGRVTRAGKLLLAWLFVGAGIRLQAAPGWPEVAMTPAQQLLATAAVASFVVAFVTIGVLVLAAVLRRRDGAWTVGVSFLVFTACAGTVVYRLGAGQTLHPWLLAGILLPLAAMSYRLARSVAAIQRDLARRYAEVEQLSARLAEQNRSLELANIRIREGSRQVEEASRLKSAFLAHMSHDLRTPLNAIIGYTRILLRRLKGVVDERQYRNLENIRVSADNLLALINTILDLSRIESGRAEIRLREVDLRALAEECADTVEALVPAGVELVRDLPPLPPLVTDGDRLRSVLMNLLGNAAKYTEAGRITLRLRAAGDEVELAVADTGVGIPAQDLAHVFDEFRQVERKDRKREGSGLGLAIVRRSIEMLGGRVHAASTVGEGSTFTVRLPRTPPADVPVADVAATAGRA